MSSSHTSNSPDPRLSKDADLFMYSLRRSDAPAHYNRDSIIASLLSFYNFIPHISPSSIQTPPPGGWQEITHESLATHSIHKTPNALDLLRHLPYISTPSPWIMLTAFACDYRLLSTSPNARDKPGWLYDAASPRYPFPPWTVMLTTGTDREGSVYILDTTDGTVTRYCAGDCGRYPPTYASDDPRSWRDGIDMETVTVEEWLGYWKKMSTEMRVLAVPSEDGVYEAPDPFFGEEDDKPGSYNYEIMQAMRKIYREHRWPDLEKYRKEDCIEALRRWYTDFEGK